MTHPLSQAPLWTEHRGPTFTNYESHVYWTETCRIRERRSAEPLLRRRNGRKTAAAPVLVAWAWVRAASIGRMAPSAALYEAVNPPACYAASLGASTALQNRSRKSVCLGGRDILLTGQDAAVAGSPRRMWQLSTLG